MNSDGFYSCFCVLLISIIIVNIILFFAFIAMALWKTICIPTAFSYFVWEMRTWFKNPMKLPYGQFIKINDNIHVSLSLSIFSFLFIQHKARCISPLKTVDRCSCCSWTFPKSQRAPFLRAMFRALLCVYACGTRVWEWTKDLISTDLCNVHQK